MAGEAQVEAETVRHAVLHLRGSLANAEGERDEAIATVDSLQRAMKELDEDKKRGDLKVNSLRDQIASMESGIRGADGRLVTAQQALSQQEERFRCGEKEKTLLTEKLNNANKQLAALQEERRELQETGHMP